MAITFVTVPGGTAYGDSLHYAAHADSPLKVRSTQIAKLNFLFKIEIYDSLTALLITCYFPPTSKDATYFYLETSLGDIVKSLIPAVEPIEANTAWWVDSVGGFLHHFIVATEIYDDEDGIPMDGDDVQHPAAPSTIADFPCAHNIAHDGDPGMDLGIYPQAFLTNDVNGIFPIAGHKQLSVWVDPSINQAIGAKVVIDSPFGSSVQYIKDEDGDIPITRPSHGRIILPINNQTLSISNKATKLTISIFPLTTPPPGGSTFSVTKIEEPPISSPPGAGVKITTNAAHGFVAGNVVTFTNTGSGELYLGDYEVLNVPNTTTFYIKATFDLAESEDEDYVVGLAYEDDLSETLPYFVEYAIKQTGCYFPVIYANHWGGFDVVDFISEDAMSVNASRDRVKLNGLKRAFGTVAAKRRELSSGWISELDYELYQGLIASNRHFKVEENSPVEVLMLTDSAKLMERRDVVSVQVTIEEQDLITNNE